MSDPTFTVIFPLWPIIILICLGAVNFVVSVWLAILRWQNNRLTKKLAERVIENGRNI